MKLFKQIANLFLILALLPAASWAQEDLFIRNKSDVAVKPLVFPLSMVVIENRPRKGLYYFYEGETRKFDEGMEGNPDSIDSRMYSILSDPQIIKKSLVATDPPRGVRPKRRRSSKNCTR